MEDQAEQSTIVKKVDQLSKFHLIDENAEMKEGFRQYLEDINFTSDSNQYNVVSIIGPQSTGKSTLMNLLFGCSFQTAERVGPQTTRGIWVSRDVERPILIFDVEGSDSMERENDSQQKSREFYEFSSGLFALKISDIFIVNIKQDSAYQENGGCQSILKYIMKLNLELFSTDTNQKLKQLIICLRDSEMDKKDYYEKDIKKNLEQLWKNIQKPEDIKSKLLSDFFDVKLIFLPHMKYQNDIFNQEIKTFKSQFNSLPFNADNLPASDFGYMIYQIWDLIKSNKDVNIPNQKTLIAKQICRDISNKILESTLSELSKINVETTNSNFSQEIDQIWNKTHTEYQNQTYKYQQSIASEVLSDLNNSIIQKIKDLLRNRIQEIKSSMEQLLDKQIKDLYTSTRSNYKKIDVVQFEEKFKIFSQNNEAGDLIEQQIQILYQTMLKDGVSQLKSIIDELLNYSQIRQTLEKYIFDGQIKILHQYLLTRRTFLIDQELKNILQIQIDGFPKEVGSFWQTLSDKVNRYVEQQSEVEDKFKSYLLRELEDQDLQTLGEYSYDKILIFYKDNVGEEKKFIKFLKDSYYSYVEFKAQPKKLSSLQREEVETLFDDAKALFIPQILQTLNQYLLQIDLSQISLFRGSIIKNVETLFSHEVLKQIITKAEQEFEQVKKSTLSTRYFDFMKGVPFQIWILMGYFAIDDIIRMITSPFWLLVLVLFASGTFYLIKIEQLDKALSIINGIWEMISPILNLAVNAGKKKIKRD